MRGKLGTGKHLDETHILLPQNVPVTGGVTPAPEPGSDEKPFWGGSGGAPPVTPISDIEGAGPTTGGDSGPGGIFGGGASYTQFEAPATSSLNLLGKIESWGVGAGTQIRSLELKIDQLTGAQLQELIKSLPDGMTYELGLEKGDA
jgi:hypothetical protein